MYFPASECEPLAYYKEYFSLFSPLSPPDPCSLCHVSLPPALLAGYLELQPIYQN